MSLIGDEVKIFDGNENDQVTIEGPKMYKKNGWYYIFAPAGGVKTGWQTVLRSKSPFGKYEYRVVMRQGSSAVNGPHQGAWVDTVTGEDWFLHFQDVYAAGRITHLQPMRWVDDWPVIGTTKSENSGIGETGENAGIVKAGENFGIGEAGESAGISKTGELCGEPVMEHRKPDTGLDAGSDVSCGRQGLEGTDGDLSDSFSSDRLSLKWQWNANYENDWYELDGHGLKLAAVPAAPSRPLGDTRNILLQKWQEPEFACITKFNLADLKEGDAAGYISMGVRYNAVTFEKTQDCIKICHTVGTQHFDCDTAYTDEEKRVVGQLENKTEVYVRYSVRQTGTKDHVEGGLPVNDAPVSEATIEISTDGRSFAYPLTIEAKAGRWVGVKHGFFIRHDNTAGSSSGSMRVEYVKNA
jgi:hypothetical protein